MLRALRSPKGLLLVLGGLVGPCVGIFGCVDDQTGSTPESDAASEEATADGGDAAEPLWDGARSPCSTGPAYDAHTVFTQINDDNPPSYPDCVPRCGDPGVVNGFYELSSLPSGSCSVEHEMCELSVRVDCLCQAEGPVQGFYCRCERGTWTCVEDALSTSFCECPADASTD